MDKDAPSSDRAIADRLPLSVYKVIIGLAAWLVVSIWGFFSDRGYTAFALAIASGFVFIAVFLPYKLWRLGRKGRDASDNPQSWLDWIKGEFETWQGRLTAADAAIEILLPIAAVAIGMTVFAIVHHFDVGSAA